MAFDAQAQGLLAVLAAQGPFGQTPSRDDEVGAAGRSPGWFICRALSADGGYGHA